MNSIKKIAYFIMIVSFAVLFDVRATGTTGHLFLGAGFTAVIVFHILAAKQWLKKTLKQIERNKAKAQVRLVFYIACINGCIVAIIAVSGIFASKLFFPGMTSGIQLSILQLHKTAAILLFPLICIHLGLHANLFLSKDGVPGFIKKVPVIFLAIVVSGVIGTVYTVSRLSLGLSIRMGEELQETDPGQSAARASIPDLLLSGVGNTCAILLFSGAVAAVKESIEKSPRRKRRKKT